MDIGKGTLESVGTDSGSPLELLAMPEREQCFNVVARPGGARPGADPVVLARATWAEVVAWMERKMAEMLGCADG